MDSTWRYQVNLGKLTCDCLDWPRVQLCKHVRKHWIHTRHHYDFNFAKCDHGFKGCLNDGVPSSMETVQSLWVAEQQHQMCEVLPRTLKHMHRR